MRVKRRQTNSLFGPPPGLGGVAHVTVGRTAPDPRVGGVRARREGAIEQREGPFVVTEQERPIVAAERECPRIEGISLEGSGGQAGDLFEVPGAVFGPALADSDAVPVRAEGIRGRVGGVKVDPMLEHLAREFELVSP